MRSSQILPLILLLATPLHAGQKIDITKAAGWDPSSVQRVIVVSAGCEGAVSCETALSAVAKAMPKAWTVVPPNRVRQALMGLGETQFTRDVLPDLLVELSTVDAPVDAVVEVSVPFARGSGGAFTGRRAEVRLEIVIRSLSGEILMTASGRRKPMNVLSGPEKVLGALAAGIFKRI